MLGEVGYPFLPVSSRVELFIGLPEVRKSHTNGSDPQVPQRPWALSTSQERGGIWTRCWRWCWQMPAIENEWGDWAKGSLCVPLPSSSWRAVWPIARLNQEQGKNCWKGRGQEALGQRKLPFYLRATKKDLLDTALKEEQILWRENSLSGKPGHCCISRWVVTRYSLAL